MGQFLVHPDVIGVASDRLVVIVRVEDDGSVVVRDLANGARRTTSASELSASPFPSDPAAMSYGVAQATDAQWDRARCREAVVASIAHADYVVVMTYSSGLTGKITGLLTHAAKLAIRSKAESITLALFDDAAATSPLP